jgi:hypothetical protein
MRFDASVVGTLDLRFRTDRDRLKIALVLEDSHSLYAPTVRWLSTRNGGFILGQINGFGTLYDRATIVINMVSVTTSEPASILPNRVQVKASLARTA